MRLVLTLLAALVVAASSACGGDDDGGEAAATTAAVTTVAEEPTTESVPPTTRPEPAPGQSRWAARIDDACRPWQERIDEVPAPSDAASLREWVDRTLPLFRRQIAAIKAVKPPSDPQEARQAREFIRSLEQLQRAFRTFRAGVRDENVAQIQAGLTAATTAGSAARTQALELGITECGGYSAG